MEIDSTEPVFMSFTSHDIFTGVHVPDFPRAVIGYSSDNLFAHVESKARDRSSVGLYSLAGRHASSNSLVSSRKVGVRASILGVRGVLGDAHAECTSSHAGSVLAFLS